MPWNAQRHPSAAKLQFAGFSENTTEHAGRPKLPSCFSRASPVDRSMEALPMQVAGDRRLCNPQRIGGGLGSQAGRPTNQRLVSRHPAQPLVARHEIWRLREGATQDTIRVSLTQMTEMEPGIGQAPRQAACCCAPSTPSPKLANFSDQQRPHRHDRQTAPLRCCQPRPRGSFMSRPAARGDLNSISGHHVGKPEDSRHMDTVI